ncbi:GlsB/YeaQ/YmgE family stress response membrane protein [Pleomorphomonas sp. PLEO]|uniref:GlsB/YeaQ/YmgE family stress response membrane protein n=1 Tax=Pleomorphomonas sp. PLEO TaxID=3239306 RepID=UPI00351DF1B3
MNDASIGWIAAIIIGGLAGWIASGLMKTDTGLFLNIVLGIIGAAIASFLFGVFGIAFGGWIGYLIAGVLGACILIGGVRAVQR